MRFRISTLQYLSYELLLKIWATIKTVPMVKIENIQQTFGYLFTETCKRYFEALQIKLCPLPFPVFPLVAFSEKKVKKNSPCRFMHFIPHAPGKASLEENSKLLIPCRMTQNHRAADKSHGINPMDYEIKYSCFHRRIRDRALKTIWEISCSNFSNRYQH